MKRKTLVNIRLSDADIQFLQNYGDGKTESLENALQRLRELEEKQKEQLALSTAELKQKRKLEFEKQKEAVKTAALRERQKIKEKNQKSKVDWGDGYVDPFRFDSLFDGGV